MVAVTPVEPALLTVMVCDVAVTVDTVVTELVRTPVRVRTAEAWSLAPLPLQVTGNENDALMALTAITTLSVNPPDEVVVA